MTLSSLPILCHTSHLHVAVSRCPVLDAACPSAYTMKIFIQFIQWLLRAHCLNESFGSFPVLIVHGLSAVGLTHLGCPFFPQASRHPTLWVIPVSVISGPLVTVLSLHSLVDLSHQRLGLLGSSLLFLLYWYKDFLCRLYLMTPKSYISSHDD